MALRKLVLEVVYRCGTIGYKRLSETATDTDEGAVDESSEFQDEWRLGSHVAAVKELCDSLVRRATPIVKDASTGRRRPQTSRHRWDGLPTLYPRLPL